jgi:hypothetical protein
MFDTTFNPVSYRSASQINEAMARVYGYMGMAVVVSLLTSMLVASSPALLQFLFTGITKWIVIFLPLVAVFAVTIALNAEPPKPVALGLLAGFAAIMGLSMSVMFAVFTLGSIVSAFMGAAILFGVMSFYGYFTKTSLDSMGKFMFVGLIAIIIASIINLFLGSSLFAMVISALAIIIFLGLTAYDTQKIREAVSMDGNDTAEVIGALTLYLDFINIFTSLLQLTGSKNSD